MSGDEAVTDLNVTLEEITRWVAVETLSRMIASMIGTSRMESARNINGSEALSAYADEVRKCIVKPMCDGSPLPDGSPVESMLDQIGELALRRISSGALTLEEIREMMGEDEE